MKVNLRDITFVIPVMIDSPERLENLQCVVAYIQRHFDTTILIVEQGEKQTVSIITMPNIDYIFEFNNYIDHLLGKATGGIFYRTFIINRGIKSADTTFISVHDTDVIFALESYVESARLLRSGVSLVYPYSGKLVDVDRSYIKDGVIKESESFALDSVGGACFLKKEDYKNAGYENEMIKGWGYEDTERRHRMIKLGYDVDYVPGTCWHIKHPVGINSGPNHLFNETNKMEYEKIRRMNREELSNYVKTWGWAS